MRLKAFIVGVLLMFTVTGALFLMGGDARVFLLAHVAAYGVVGAILGFLWPEGGWRLGLWLVAFWFIMQLLSAPFADPRTFPRDTKEFLENLLANMMVVVAACLGAAIGAAVKRQRVSYTGEQR